MTRLSTAHRPAGLLTIASGPDKYVDFALALGASLRRFERWRGPTAIVTDRDASVFAGLFDEVVDIRDFSGSGVEQKLSLDLMTPFQETLFVDCDSLAFRDLAPTVERFRRCGEDFGALAGHYVGRDDEHYAISDLTGYLDAVGIERLPAFNSGMLWWTAEGARVFEEARRIAHSDSVELVQSFKDSRLADEPVLGAAMERLRVDFAFSRSDHMVPTVAVTSLRGIDVVKGRARVPTAQGLVSPAMLHFNYGGQERFSYARERLRARHPLLPPSVASLVTSPSWVRAHGRAALSRSLRPLRRR